MSFEDIPRDVDALRRERYVKLRTAIPFPALDWSRPDDGENLAQLRDYAETMANSAIDWYLEKKRGKKRFARFLHWATYISTGLAAIGPLLKISALLEIPGLTTWNGMTAEVSLALAGVAGGFSLLDRVGGYSDDWMRFMATAARINRALVTFQFKWEKAERALLRTGRIPADIDEMPADANKISKDAAVDAPPPVEALATARPLDDGGGYLIQLTNRFCLDILDIVGEETSVWVNEMTQRMGRAETHLSWIKRQP